MPAPRLYAITENGEIMTVAERCNSRTSCRDGQGVALAQRMCLSDRASGVVDTGVATVVRCDANSVRSAVM